MELRIIRLEDNPSMEVSSFEEAFGDFSEARGRGRARRKKRRTERKKNRQEKRMTRIKDRAERRKEKRKMRAEALEDRLAKRRRRKEERVSRKAMGDSGEEEPTTEEETTTEEEEPEESEEEMEEPEEEMEETEEEEPEEEEETSGFNASKDNFDEYFNYSGDDFYNMDSIVSGDDVLNIAEFQKGAEDYYSGADGTPVKINSKLKDITNKIEWNKEIIARLTKKLRTSRMGREDVAKTKANLKDRQNALALLQEQLRNYSKYATAKSGSSMANREIAKSSSVARLNRFKAIGSNKIGMTPEKALVKSIQISNNRSKPTPVDGSLRADISQGRIVVPEEQLGESCFNGDGVTQYDVNFSNAVGDDKKKKRNKIIAIVGGVVLASVIIYLVARRKK